MLVQTGIYLEDDVVAEIDAKIGRGSRSEWIRGAMRLRLVLEQMVADDEPVTDAKVRQALMLVESPVIA
jgi:metal-responsive CopG/Arc/MetJ family transcriptional regulator